ncbi:hypothetical protein [Nostoc sp.]
MRARHYLLVQPDLKVIAHSMKVGERAIASYSKYDRLSYREVKQ